MAEPRSPSARLCGAGGRERNAAPAAPLPPGVDSACVSAARSLRAPGGRAGLSRQSLSCLRVYPAQPFEVEGVLF